MHLHIVKMYKDKEVKQNVKNIFFINVWLVYCCTWLENLSIQGQHIYVELNINAMVMLLTDCVDVIWFSIPISLYTITYY
jgi:hypothetical protein